MLSVEFLTYKIFGFSSRCVLEPPGWCARNNRGEVGIIPPQVEFSISYDMNREKGKGNDLACMESPRLCVLRHDRIGFRNHAMDLMIKGFHTFVAVA